MKDIPKTAQLNLHQYPGAPCGDFSGYCDKNLKCHDHTTDFKSKLKAASTLLRDECENGDFTLKTYLRKRSSNRSFWIYSWGKLGQGSRAISSFSKSFVFKMFSFHTENANSAFSDSSGLKCTLFRKAPFSWRMSVDGRPKRRNKVALSNSSSVTWTDGASVFGKCFEKITGVTYH